MASYLRPRRGKKATAEAQNIILKRGEIFFEAPTTGIGTGIGKMKMGDGTTPYVDLPYFMEQPEDIANASLEFTETSEGANAGLLAKIVSGAKMNIIVPAIKNLLFNLDKSVTQLNNDLVELGTIVQTNKNNISVLDTRVTNAINGGQLIEPFSYNYLIGSFNSTAQSGMPILENTATKFSVQANYSNHWGYRTYPAQTVPKKGKLKYSFNAWANAHTASVILVINGTALASATSPSQLSGELDLNNYVGQSITVQIQLSPDGAGGDKAYMVLNTLLLSNE